MRNALIILYFIAAFALQPSVAQAYIGPGLGVGVISAVLGFVASIGMAIVALLWYPFKRLFRRRKPSIVRRETPHGT
jgi:D-serine dehydratase